MFPAARVTDNIVSTATHGAPCRSSPRRADRPDRRFARGHARRQLRRRRIIKGSATVLIGGKPAARVTDPRPAAASMPPGEPTVLIGG